MARHLGIAALSLLGLLFLPIAVAAQAPTILYINLIGFNQAHCDEREDRLRGDELTEDASARMFCHPPIRVFCSLPEFFV